MTRTPVQIPRFPAVLGYPLRILPLAPLSASLTAYSRRIARQHPGLFRRLGAYDHTDFVLDPTDLPFVVCLNPNGGVPRVVLARGASEEATRIAGPLAALLGLVHGAYDGDALFFSRDLMIEGDTSAVLALRNAIDDAELNLAQEFTDMSGPLKRPLMRVVALLERRSGVSLTRPEEAEAW